MEVKQKDQDICVTPNDIQPSPETLKMGLLEGNEDTYGAEYTKKH